DGGEGHAAGQGRVDAHGLEDYRQQRARGGGDHQVDGHGGGDDEADQVVVEPQGGDRPHHQRPQHAVEAADGEFLGEQPAQVAAADLAEGHAAHHHGEGLVAGDTAHVGDDGHQYGEGHHL